MKLKGLLILLVCFSFNSFGQPLEIEIMNKLEILSEVMVQPNEEILSNLVSEYLVYVHSSGTVRNKQGFIDEFI